MTEISRFSPSPPVGSRPIGAVESALFESGEGLFVAEPAGNVLWVNRAFSTITGLAATEIEGRSMKQLWPSKGLSAHQLDFEAVRAALDQEGRWQGNIWIDHPDLGPRCRWLSLSTVVREGRRVYVVGLLLDSASTAPEILVRSDAHGRALMLPNRVYLLDRLERWMTTLRLKQGFGTVIVLHLTDFNALRTAFGESESELFVVQVVDRLTERLGEIDTLVRASQDQLVLLLETAKRSRSAAFAATRILCEELVALFRDPFEVLDQKRYCAVSAGIALFGERDLLPIDLLREAEIAMAQSREKGPNHFQFYDESMQAALEARVSLEQEMRLAVPQQELVLYYQPQVDRRGTVIGYEALIRWNHPVFGLMNPSDFLALAEANRLIVDFGYWVIEEAARTVAAWADDPKTRAYRISVNISAVQFSEADFVDRVRDILKATGASPGKLRIEMTESIFLEDFDRVIGMMHQLKAQGLTLSLDDFGTGYSTMAYLRQLPIDELKIPQTFVQEAQRSAVDEGIIRAVISFAETLGLDVVAEGVETEAQWDFLKQLGCNCFQGYLFGKPMRLSP